MLFKMWCQIGQIVTRVILFTLKAVSTMSKHPKGLEAFVFYPEMSLVFTKF